MLTKHRKVRAILNSVIALALMLTALLTTMGSASAASPPGILECPSSPPSNSDPQWKPVLARGLVTGRPAPRLPRHHNLTPRPESREARAFRNFSELLDQTYEYRKMMNEITKLNDTFREWERMNREYCTQNDPHGYSGPYPPTGPVVVPYP